MKTNFLPRTAQACLAAAIWTALLLNLSCAVALAEDTTEPTPAQPHLFRLDVAAKEKIKPVRQFTGHTGPVNCVQFVPDGKRVVSASDDGTLRVWQIDDGRQLCSVKGLEGQLKTVVLTNEHQAFAAGSSKRIYVCNLDSGTVEQTLNGPTSTITKLAVSRNGLYIAALDDEGHAYTWDASHGLDKVTAPGKPLPKHPAAAGKLTEISFDPKQALLWATGDFPNLVSWTYDSWKPAGELVLAESAPQRRFCISAEGFHLIAASANTFCTARRATLDDDFARSVRVQHVSSLANIQRVLQAGNDYFALLGGDGAIEFWRGRDDQFAGQFPAPVDGITSVTYAPPLKMTLTGHADGSLSLWSVDALRERPEDVQWEAIRECQKLLADKKFDELTDRINQLRHDESCSQTGIPILHLLYGQLAAPENKDWMALQAKLIEWRAAKPASIAPYVVQAKALTDEAWASRGSGWANSVTQEGWQGFADKLKQSHDTIDEAKMLQEEDPELFCDEITVLMGLSQPREEIDAVMKKGAEIDPTYFPLYETATVAHMTRWSGNSPDEVAKWVGDICDESKDHGDEAYAHIAMELVEYSCNGDFSQEATMDWNRIKRGLDSLLDKYDDSKYLANDAGYMAVMKLDREMAHKALPILGLNRQASAFWGERGHHHWQIWAAADEIPVDAQQQRAIVFPQGADCVALSADGKLAVVIGTASGGHFELFETDAWRSVYKRQAMGSDFSVLAAHPSTPMFAVAGGPISPEGSQPHGLSYGLDFLDFSQGQPKIMVFHGECAHTDRVAALAFSPDKTHWASGGLDSRIKLWDLPLVEHAHPQDLNLPSGVVGLAYTADGKSLTAATQKDGVLLWDVESNQQLDKLPHALQNYPVEQGKVLATSHAGSLVAYLNDENCVTVYDCKAKSSTVTLPAIEGKVFALAFSPDDTLLATAGDAKQVDLWDAATGKLLHSFKGHFDTIRNVCFVPSQTTLLTLADEGTLRVWDISKFVKKSLWGSLLDSMTK